MTRSLNPTELKRLHRSWKRRSGGRLALLLDGVGQPYNVGSIVRTAAALGVEQLWLAGGSDPRHPSARKTSMGTERLLRWDAVGSGVAGVAAAREDGFRVVAVELAVDARPLHELDLTGDVCLVLGNEDHGCSAGALAAVDAVGYVPQVGKVGSLNVAVAAGIALVEVRRQSWTAGGAADGGEGGEGDGDDGDGDGDDDDRSRGS